MREFLIAGGIAVLAAAAGLLFAGMTCAGARSDDERSRQRLVADNDDLRRALTAAQTALMEPPRYTPNEAASALTLPSAADELPEMVRCAGTGDYGRLDGSVAVVRCIQPRGHRGWGPEHVAEAEPGVFIRWTDDGRTWLGGEHDDRPIGSGLPEHETPPGEPYSLADLTPPHGIERPAAAALEATRTGSGSLAEAIAEADRVLAATTQRERDYIRERTGIDLGPAPVLDPRADPLEAVKYAAMERADDLLQAAHPEMDDCDRVDALLDALNTGPRVMHVVIDGEDEPLCGLFEHGNWIGADLPSFRSMQAGESFAHPEMCGYCTRELAARA